MRVRGAAILLTGWLTLACAGGNAARDEASVADVAAVRQAIETSKGRLVAAFKAGDGQAAAAEYAPNAIIMSPNEPALEGAAIAPALSGMFEQIAMPNMTQSMADLTVSGDYAFEHGTYEWTIQPRAPGAPAMPDKGKYLSIWQRQSDGSWKLLRDIWNTSAAQ